MNEKKRVIGLDFDDVLHDFRVTMEKRFCELHGVCLTRDECTSYDLWDRWGGTPDDSIQKILSYYESDHHDRAPTIPGSLEAVKKLKKNHKIVVITSRPDYIKDRTLAWLERNFGLHLFDQVYFANLFANKDGKKKLKSEICHELGVDVFVDDYHVYAQDVAESGEKVLLLDAPWNRVDNLHPNITRVNSWNHILEVLCV